MSSVIASTRFSVLDRSRTREGHTHAEALRDTVRPARDLEFPGCQRLWVSEPPRGLLPSDATHELETRFRRST